MNRAVLWCEHRRSAHSCEVVLHVNKGRELDKEGQQKPLDIRASLLSFLNNSLGQNAALK